MPVSSLVVESVMWKPVDKRQKTLLVFAVVCLAVAGVRFFVQWLDPGSNLNQHINIERAQKHAQVAEAAVAGDLRFKRVRFGGDTGNAEPGAERYGCLWVLGYVSTQEDLDSLRSAVMATNPPVDVRWDVRIEPE